MATTIDQKLFVKTALRIPPDLHEAVHASAQKNGRSYNAELVHLIDKALSLPAGWIGAPSLVRSVTEDGKLTEESPVEVMQRLAHSLREASGLAEMFLHFSDPGASEPLEELTDEEAEFHRRNDEDRARAEERASEPPATPIRRRVRLRK